MSWTKSAARTLSTPAHIRAFGEALIGAADEIDMMASRDVAAADNTGIGPPSAGGGPTCSNRR
jgi:hypothetical protein